MSLYLFKQIRVEEHTVLVGKAGAEDLAGLARQGYKEVLDIMPKALKDKDLARRVKEAGMKYLHIPVEECDLKSCRIEEERVKDFFRYLAKRGETPIIVHTDDEVLGISLVMLADVFEKGEPSRTLIRSLETLGISLRGRRDIKRFIRDFYEHYRKALPSNGGPSPKNRAAAVPQKRRRLPKPEQVGKRK